MAPSTITAKCSDGMLRTVYCHFDGYKSEVGRMLKEHYTDLKKIEELLSLGAVKFLDKEITCPKGHTWDTPVEGHTVFFTRDRGDDFWAGEGKNAKAAIKSIGGEQFNYVYKDGVWKCNGKPY